MTGRWARLATIYVIGLLLMTAALIRPIPEGDVAAVTATMDYTVAQGSAGDADLPTNRSISDSSEGALETQEAIPEATAPPGGTAEPEPIVEPAAGNQGTAQEHRPGAALLDATPNEASTIAAPSFPLPLVKAKGIYITGYSAASPNMFAGLMALVESTELNAVVIDVKDDWGNMTYIPPEPLPVSVPVSGSPIADLPTMLKQLRSRGVYPIARLVAFKDSAYPRQHPDVAVRRKDGGLWEDRNGQTWIDPHNRRGWEYLLALAKDAARLGFAEIQFDYVRFPSDGPMDVVVYPAADGRPREKVIAEFLGWARHELAKEGVWTSADIFGVVTSVHDDQGIGQVLEDLAGAVDILSPMVYPSHYASGEFGLSNPNGAPHQTVLKALQAARLRIEKDFPSVRLRPWLQDFSLGYPSYDNTHVRAQIQATVDAGYDEWLLWNPSNRYTQSALLPHWQGVAESASVTPVVTPSGSVDPPLEHSEAPAEPSAADPVGLQAAQQEGGPTQGPRREPAGPATEPTSAATPNKAASAQSGQEPNKLSLIPGYDDLVRAFESGTLQFPAPNITERTAESKAPNP